MDPIFDISKDMEDESFEKSSERHPKADLCLPELPSNRKWNYEEKATQNRDNKSPDEHLDNSHEQSPNESPENASNHSSDESSHESSDKSYHRFDSSPSYSSDDTEPKDIRESEAYIKSSDKERRRLIRRQKKLDKRVDKVALRRKIKAGKKAMATSKLDYDRRSNMVIRNWKRGPVFETEASRAEQCRGAEDEARDISGAGGADGRTWSDNDQKALELRRVNEDFMKLGMELYKWRHRHYDGPIVLRYRAEEVTKLIRIFERQWREAYERIADNLVKLKELKLHSTERQNRGLDNEKEKKAADENAQSDKLPTTQGPPIKKPGAHPTMAAKPIRKPARPQQQKLRPKSFAEVADLLAQKAGQKTRG